MTNQDEGLQHQPTPEHDGPGPGTGLDTPVDPTPPAADAPAPAEEMPAYAQATAIMSQTALIDLAEADTDEFELPVPVEMADEHSPYSPTEFIAEEDDTWSGTFSVAGLRRALALDRARYVALSRAIQANPDSPANYVIRGEMLLEAGEPQAAAEDFSTALVLAEKYAENTDWGYISAALIDRARLGLRRCS